MQDLERDIVPNPRPGDLIGFRRDGRPIYLIGGGAPDNDGGDGGDGGGNNNDDDGSGSGLLDDDDGGGTDNDDDDGGDDEQVTLSRTELETLIDERANRVTDRRINQALETRDKKARKKAPAAKKQAPAGGGTDEPAAPQGPSPMDTREARLVYREYVGDEVKFLSNEERSLAQSLAQGHISRALADGDDVEAAGQQAAKEVAEQIKKVRGSYERQIIDRLQRRGALPQDFKVQAAGGPKKSGADRPRWDGKKMAESIYGAPQKQS